MAIPHVALAVDFGGTNTRMALVSSKGQLLEKVVCPSEDVQNPHLFLEWIKRQSHELTERHNIPLSRVRGIGLGMPGSINPSEGLVYFLPNLPKWKNVYLVKLIQNALPLRTRIDNDGNVMALAEHLFGAARGYKNALFMTLGTGIGCGLVIENKLFQGSTFSAAELAHMRHAYSSQTRCACGNRGCIETAWGNKYLLRDAYAYFKGKKSLLNQWLRQNPNQKLELEMITQAAQKGDKIAIQFWEEKAFVLGDFLAGICNLLNPEILVMGGGVMGANQLIIRPLRQSIRAHAFEQASKHLKIVRAHFGKEAGIMGAASLIFCDKP